MKHLFIIASAFFLISCDGGLFKDELEDPSLEILSPTEGSTRYRFRDSAIPIVFKVTKMEDSGFEVEVSNSSRLNEQVFSVHDDMNEWEKYLDDEPDTLVYNQLLDDSWNQTLFITIRNLEGGERETSINFEYIPDSAQLVAADYSITDIFDPGAGYTKLITFDADVEFKTESGSAGSLFAILFYRKLENGNFIPLHGEILVQDMELETQSIYKVSGSIDGEMESGTEIYAEFNGVHYKNSVYAFTVEY